MNPRGECLKELKKLGFALKEHGHRHDKYYSEELNYTITVKRHDFDEDDTRYILKEIRHEIERQQGRR